MNRTEKQATIDELHQEFDRSPHAILVDFRGLTVPAVTEFRRKVRQSGSRYRVVKNSLALRAAKDTPLEIRTDGEALIIRPAKLTKKERIRESTKRMMAIHDETLRKLAK